MKTWYLMPTTGTGQDGDSLFPKHFVGGMSIVYFGLEGLCFCHAQPTFNEALVIHSDAETFVLCSEGDLENVIGDTTALEAFLESHNIPAGWLNPTWTWHQLIDRLSALAWFIECIWFAMDKAQLFGGGRTLNSQWNSLPSQARTRIAALVAELGIDASGVTGTTTLRQALRLLAGQINHAWQMNTMFG